MDFQSLINSTVKYGAASAAVISVSDISFSREFRTACEKNTCGKYGKCWMCPPDVGDIDDMIKRAKAYKHALIYQTISELEDSFDVDGMQEAAEKHNKLAQTLSTIIMPLMNSPLCLGAGACQVCERCSRCEELPCRYPKKAISSLEAYGIAVSELAASCGMKYINGQNTVTFFGGFLFD